MRNFSGNWTGNDDGKSKIFDDIDDSSESTVSSIKPVVTRKSNLFTAAPQRRQPIVSGTPKISISQALYLAKEAGIYTTREIQTHYIKSPNFSINSNPYLIENFFGDDSGDLYSADIAGAVVGAPAASPGSIGKPTEDAEKTVSEISRDKTPMQIHQVFQSMSLTPPVITFPARGREWKDIASGTGTRKRSTCHVVITRGTGIVKVNGEEDFFKRWPLLYNRFDVLYPFEACNAAGLFDVYISVKGGGISGQAGAARLAVGRALVDACSLCEDDLKDSLVLYEDTRQRTSKFSGRKGAYARWNWTLR